MNLGIIFLTGLTVGGLTCLAVQGGLLASVLAAREDVTTTQIKRHALFATFVFLISKLFAYTVLGFILGAFGGALNIGGNVQTFMQLLAGLYMLAVALNLLNIHPIFRYAIIQPPRALARLVRNQSKSKDFFAPALLGAMTIFIPCGTTIGMEALAISSANTFTGGAIMGAFILGTTPLFFGIGYLTSVLGEAFKTKFLKLAAVVVIYLGATSIYGALVAMGAPTFETLVDSTAQALVGGSSSDQNAESTQKPEILITPYGYSPSYIRVKAGEPVKITLKNKDAYSCASAFRIPSYRIGKNVGPNETAEVTFTPTRPGKIIFSCSMGMYQGIIEAI